MTLEKQLLYLLSKVGEIEGKKLIKTYEAMGYTPQIIRNLLTKLKKEKYIDSLNRAIYRITPLGKEVLSSLYFKRDLYSKHWDGKWYIILIEIPEMLRKKRDIFRRKLIQFGFGQLNKSVYVYPWDITKDVINIIDTLEIEDYVTILASNEFLLNKISKDGEKGANKALEIWKIEELNNIYKEKFERFEMERKSDINKLLNNQHPDDLIAFSYYLEICKLINELLDIDPMLPPEFLPGSWGGTKVLSELNRLYKLIANIIPKESIYYIFVEKDL
ncbi:MULTISPECIES: PaaX family transcriptional regulator C-terminal domain-containing protein [Bacillaceae]|uniref:PaaX family transcriptional regulator C-terminal domain-containing protein n=1 Tax=Bacillaceae TaxID=186817 RepID=UPI00096AFFD9|nr:MULTISPECIES: PaaX family transcriptional regulator C-terminal domain-containing protein [Bacillaceae]